MSVNQGLESFRHLVFRESELRSALKAPTEIKHFIELVVALGRKHGFVFTAEDVNEAMAAGRMARTKQLYPK